MRPVLGRVCRGNYPMFALPQGSQNTSNRSARKLDIGLGIGKKRSDKDPSRDLVFGAGTG